MAELLGAQMPNVFQKIHFQINWVLILIVLLVFIAACITIYVIWNRRTYRYKIIVFENLSGQGFQPTIRDKARILKVGDGGEEILFLKKKKVYRTAYGRKMGNNTYWFAVGQDGYWYNIVLGDLDAKMGMLDIEPIDRDMRYAHVSIRRNIQDRYKAQNFMEKYGSIMMNGLFLLIMLIGIGILLGKIGDIATTVNTGIEASNKLVSVATELLTRLENSCGTGGMGGLYTAN